MPKMTFGQRAPRSKIEFLNRMLSYDFGGDLRDLFPEGVTITRLSAQSILLTAKDDPARRFELVVRIPRTEAQREAHRAKLEARKAEGKPARRRPQRPNVQAPGTIEH